ncbi:MAG TPA: hypothetical protein VIR29_00875 [Anseongella sp.]
MKLEKFTSNLDAIEEYESEPVPAGKLKGWKSFLGMYAGEHTAGTEFVIGPLFVVHGVTAVDLVTGLLVGNLLAVLSWVFLCAPVATGTRITLYNKLEKICGRNLARIYNLVNGVMFCFLAGSMIAVSATAVGIPFGIEMPGLSDWMPGSLGWVIAVFGVGLVITVVAVLGYDQIARFSNIAAPWMILVFLGAGLSVLPELGVASFSDFWRVANEKIWVGATAENVSRFNFWHVMFFAWFANMAMHIGMSDMSILRYARKWQHGFASAAGVYLGHFLAWMAAGILYAVVLVQIVPQGMTLAAYLPTIGSDQMPSVAPGPLATYAIGVSGALCVIVAGWTTANPTIYRAGLAIQAMMPRVKRWKVTLVVGLFTTIAACFPALVMKLLDFVALYGLVLMPMGAIIFIDYHLFPRLKLQTDLAEQTGSGFNWAAGLTWFITLIAAVLLNIFGGMEIFFLGLPGWFVAALLYVAFSRLLQKRIYPKPAMIG